MGVGARLVFVVMMNLVKIVRPDKFSGDKFVMWLSVVQVKFGGYWAMVVVEVSFEGLRQWVGLFGFSILGGSVVFGLLMGFLMWWLNRR
jgi:hypothetical protein